MEAAADSPLAKVTARIVMPVLIFLLTLSISIIGWFVIQSSNRIEATQAKQAKDQREVAEEVSVVKSDVRVIYTRLDAQVLRQIELNTKKLDNHEDRIQKLERSVPTP